MIVSVDAQVPDSREGRVWARRLEMWLADAPSCVKVSMRCATAAEGDVVDVHDVIRFLRARRVGNTHYHGRALFYYMVEVLHGFLVVRCTRCAMRYGLCRCEDRGAASENGGWNHQGFLKPSRSVGQDFWVIERASLVARDPSTLPNDLVPLRRRLLAYLEFVRQAN